MLELTSLLAIVNRLKAALSLVTLAETVIPQWVKDGNTTEESAALILQQIPALRADIEAQIQSVLKAMETIQDRVEALAQFMLLHRAALTAPQAEQLDRHLTSLRT